MGINVDTTISLTFLLGGMLAGAAGLIYALYQTTIWFFQGFQAGLIAFTAAVMGGIGNLRGAVLGGLIIGFIQQISDNRIGGMDPGDGVRLPDPDHGVPPAGPAGRGDEGGRMSATAAPDRESRTAAPPERRQMPDWCGEGRRARSSSGAVILPFFFDTGGAVHPDASTRAGLRRHGARPEHRRRLRRPARPGVRGLLRHRGLHMGWFGSGFFARSRRQGHPHPRHRRSPRSCPAST